MSLNESIVEDAALEWFGGLGYAIGHGPQLAPGEPAAEQDSFDEVALARGHPAAEPGHTGESAGNYLAIPKISNRKEA